MSKSYWIAGLAALFAVGCASAEFQAELQQADEEFIAINENGEEVVCRYERAMGTRLAERVCKTREQIENERAEQRQGLDRRNAGPDGSNLPRTPPGGFGG